MTLPRPREPRLLPVVTAIFVAVLILTPLLSSKMVAIGPLVMPGGTFIFPVAFILNDVLTEVYGYERSRRVIWAGLGCQLLAAFCFWAVGSLPAASYWQQQEAWSVLFGVAPRLLIASLLAYLLGEFANSVVLSRMKFAQSGQRGLMQGWRFVASTLAGEGLDSIVFMTVGFLGVLTPGELLRTMVTIYFVKVAYEVVALPISMPLSNWLKRYESLDPLDDPNRTRYNPFLVRASSDA